METGAQATAKQVITGLNRNICSKIILNRLLEICFEAEYIR
jgi:hypothetical protein